MTDQKIIGIAQMDSDSKVMLGAIIAGLLDHAKEMKDEHEAIKSLETLLLKCGDDTVDDIPLTVGEAKVLEAILIMNKMMGESNEGQTIH